MLRFIDNVRTGIVDPVSLKYAECTRRAFSMALSKSRDVEGVHKSAVTTLNIECIEGRYLLSGGATGSLAIHDVDNTTGVPSYTCKVVGEVPRNYRNSHKSSVETVQWYPLDTGMFTSSGFDGKLIIWDSNTMEPKADFNLPPRIYQHHMSPLASKNCLIAVGRPSCHITMVDLKSGSFTHELRGHSREVMTVQWSPRDENLIASGGCDNRLLLWDIRSPKAMLESLDQHSKYGSRSKVSEAHSGNVSGLCFTEDGLQLLSFGAVNQLHLWDMRTGRKEPINFGKVPNATKKTVKFDISRNSNPDVVYFPSQGNMYMYELNSGSNAGTLLGHFNVVNCCVFHPFYQELYSGGNDRNILIWTPDNEPSECYSNSLQSATDNKPGLKRTSVTADSWSDDES